MLVRRCIWLFFALTSFSFAQLTAQQPGAISTFGPACASISARVYFADGQPAPGATVEFRAIQSGNTRTLDAGPRSNVDVNCATPGWYRITARLGQSESSEELNVGPGQVEMVTLRLPNTQSAGAAPTVSASQLRMPEKARKEIEKAEQRLFKHDTQGALKCIEESLKAYPDNSEAYRLRGLVSLTEGRPADAVNDLDRAVKLDSGNAMARVILGATFNALSKFKDAARAITGALPIAPQMWQAQYELGKAYAGMGNLKQALQTIDRAIALNPKFAPMRYVRGAILLKAHEYADGARDLQQYLHDEPNGPEAASARKLLASVQASLK